VRTEVEAFSHSCRLVAVVTDVAGGDGIDSARSKRADGDGVAAATGGAARGAARRGAPSSPSDAIDVSGGFAAAAND